MLRFGSKTCKMVLRYYRYLDGGRDTYIPKATADRFGGEVHHCAELGHWAMLEEPQQLASHLAAFSRR